ncbi:hypothetical protein [Niveispirillum fermenti]|uniref:hypothetical protein n=1 Tax=Niveispirillum fermenti TaxID=1233113 RepID=UPI003A8B78A0
MTLPFANKLVLLTPAGRLVEMLHDPAGTVMSRPTNLAWGGAAGSAHRFPRNGQHPARPCCHGRTGPGASGRVTRYQGACSHCDRIAARYTGAAGRCPVSMRQGNDPCAHTFFFPPAFWHCRC